VAAVLKQRVAAPANAIATLHRGSYGRVELLRCDGAVASPPRSEIAARLHFTLPLVGAFVWHADGADVFADPTAMLCTQAGEPFRISHPYGGDQSLVFTPSSRALAHISGLVERTGFSTRRRVLHACSRAQLLAHTLCCDPFASRDVLAADECLLQFFEHVVSADAVHFTRDDSLVGKVLEYVHDTEPSQLTLTNIAAAMRVRAAHLTHTFAQRTGRPLYRYVMSLKLARALHRIATRNEDLTHVALDLGFSSHSHLSAVFKARYGLSPSQLRQRCGRTGRSRSQPATATSDETLGCVQLRWRPLCEARGGALPATT